MKVKIGHYASYIHVREGESSIKTKQLDDNIYIDYNEKGEVVGIEILTELEPEYYEDTNG